MSEAEKIKLEKKYVGKTIRIIEMCGEPSYTGKVGEVILVDDAGSLHGTWGGLAVLLEDGDRIEIV